MDLVSPAPSFGSLGDRTAVRPGRHDPGDGAAARIQVADEFTGVVQRMLSGDSDAFRLVYRALQPGLLRYVTALVGASEAEDVTSETWAQAIRDLHRFRGDGDRFRAWITTIGRHRALDHLRAKRRRPVIDAAVDELPDQATGEDAEQGALDAMSTTAALALIRSLPSDQAEAVLLRSVIGLDAKAAGKLLGKRAGAVRTAAHRGLRTLAAQLDREMTVSQRGSDVLLSGDADGVT